MTDGDRTRDLLIEPQSADSCSQVLPEVAEKLIEGHLAPSTEHLAQLEGDGYRLLESYAGLSLGRSTFWDQKNATERIK
jgi:hypothetical protein